MYKETVTDVECDYGEFHFFSLMLRSSSVFPILSTKSQHAFEGEVTFFSTVSLLFCEKFIHRLFSVAVATDSSPSVLSFTVCCYAWVLCANDVL